VQFPVAITNGCPVTWSNQRNALGDDQRVRLAWLPRNRKQSPISGGNFGVTPNLSLSVRGRAYHHVPGLSLEGRDAGPGTALKQEFGSLCSASRGNTNTRSEIWNYHSGECYDCYLLRCDAVWSGRYVSAFRKPILLPWRHMQQVPLKHWSLSTRLHDVTSQKRVTLCEVSPWK
jgi:hypothetical protein